jgi:hypothetical protein
MGGLICGYFERRWQIMKKDCELLEERLEERMSALEKRLQRYEKKF